jgi:hypothetical protein
MHLKSEVFNSKTCLWKGLYLYFEESK